MGGGGGGGAGQVRQLAGLGRRTQPVLLVLYKIFRPNIPPKFTATEQEFGSSIKILKVWSCHDIY